MQRIVVKCGRFYRSIPRSVNSSLNNYNKSVPYLQYSSTTSSTGPKTFANGIDDKLSERTVLKRNVVQSTESTNWYPIESIKFFAEERVLQILFSGGQALNFNTYWLRDSCRCDRCVHPVTRTKLADSADIGGDLFIEKIDWSEDTIEIQWRTGLTDDHISQYSVEWLKMFDDVFEANQNNAFDVSLVNRAPPPMDGIYGSMVPKPDVFLWDSNQINKQSLTTSYEDFMNSTESLTSHLESFCRFGVAFLENVPIEQNSILGVARRMGYERQTSYGPTFDVAYTLSPTIDSTTESSYAAALGDSHTDLPYRERSPGVQLLHCLKQASTGGASTMADGFNCAHIFKETNPELFQVLAKNPVLFSYCDYENDLWYREKWPIISLNNDQSIKEIHYSRIAMRPPLMPLKLLDKFYLAYRKFSELVRSEELVYSYVLRPGDLVMFNNRRILHGREQFDHLKEKRRLEGCFMDLDEVNALYEKIRRQSS